MKPEVGMTVRVKETYEIQGYRGAIGIIETIHINTFTPIPSYAGVRFARKLTPNVYYIYFTKLQYKKS